MDATHKVQVNVGSLADMGKRFSLAWNRALIDKAALENPCLPLQLIEDTVRSLEAAKTGQLVPYSFG